MSSRHRYLTGDPEENTGKASPHKINHLPSTVLENQKQVDDAVTEDETLDESMDDGNLDSEDGSLMIMDIQEGKDTDDTERDSGHSEEDDHVQLIYNGTMSRRQSKQFHGAGGNFAVFSVRAGGKTKNRTCEYCGVVKATPAALIRHVRKHTGEKPFVCQSCGKAYKAKRSLHLHQNTHHRDMGQLLPPNPTSQINQVPISSPVIMQSSTTPAISEATKSLLRETLESSRKARDENMGNQIFESFGSTFNSQRVSERLPTPNLVNLLTSDISKKVQPSDEPVCLIKGVINLSKGSSNANANYIVSPPLVKKEKVDVELADNEDEEQAQDLSMQTMQKSVNARLSTSERRLKCELCNKSFKHDISRTNHMRTAHNIIISFSGTPLPKQMDIFPPIEQKSSSNINDLPHVKHEHLHQKQEMPTDLSVLAVHSRKLADSTAGLVSQEAVKMESLLTNTDALLLDESDTLPYNVTSRMVQDFDVEKLILKGIEKSVLAEDGGNRRLRMTVSRETVLATRLDGINNVTGRQATVFKCHLCTRVFSSMLRFHHHLPTHFDAEMQTFDCRYCEAAFRSLTQIVKHLQCHREKFSGLSQTGAGLNSSALLLEEFHRKQKHDHAGNVISNSPAILFSPLLQSDESLNGTPQLEPGERANGGYTCAKCRKSFSREYLLQRHMRIHQNQNMFYCPECESGFSGELDMIDHRKKVHDVKSTTEQLQYSNLLRNISESKQGLTARQAFVSDNNNNNSSGGVLGSQLFPLVDMKAFDLRRGEAVEVRMSSEVTDSNREELVRRAMLERYKALILAARGTEQFRAAFPAVATEEQQKRKLDSEKTKREAEEEVRMTKETEKKRKMEHERFRRILAQEGMGDVTVVLPDAPPPDDASEATGDIDRPTDLSMASEPPSGVGFMARKAVPKLALTASQNDRELEKDYQTEDSVKMEYEMPSNSAETTRNSTETIGNNLKRPTPDSADTNPGPSSKSRRKTHKPQKINKGDKADNLEGETGEDSNNNKTTASRTSFPNCFDGIYPNMKGMDLMNQTVLSHLVTSPGHLANSELVLKKLSAISYPSKSLSSSSTAPSGSLLIPSCGVTECPNNGAIDLTTDSKDPHAKLSATALLYQANRKMAASSSSSSHSTPSSPPVDGTTKWESKNINSGLPSFTRSSSQDPTAFDSDSSQSQEVTTAADLSKTTMLSLQIPTSQDGLVGCPQSQWKPGLPWHAEMSENLLGVINGNQWNGKKSKPLSCTSKSRASTPSPVPSPTNSDASSSAEGRKVTTTSLSRTHSSTRATSLSRTHSRLSIVNEPLDRNSLCKPQVLDDGRSVYTCVICHKQFLSLSDINRHMDFHEDIRPYKCKYCDYYARTNSQLKVHKLRHEGVREFCCRVCNYKGVTQSDLNRHMKSQVHLLRSNHVCSQCGEGFVTPKTLRDHVCCTGSRDKSFENSSTNEIDDDVNNDEYEEEEIVNSETSQGSNNSVSEDVAVEAV